MRIETGWAAISPGGGTPCIDVGSVSWSRRDAQRYIGEAWAMGWETPDEGWRMAHKAGWRCAGVTVSAIEQMKR